MQERSTLEHLPASVPAMSLAASSSATAHPNHIASHRASARAAVLGCAVFLDSVLVWSAFCGAYYLRYQIRWVPAERGTIYVPFLNWLPFGVLFTITVILSLSASGLYRIRPGRDLVDETMAIVRASLVAVGLVVIMSTFMPIAQYSRLVVVYAWLLVIPLLTLVRSAVVLLAMRLQDRGWNTRRVVVVGTTPLSKMVLHCLFAKRGHGYRLVGFLQESPVLPTGGGNARPAYTDFGRFRCLGGIDEIDRVVTEWQVDEVFVALPASAHQEMAQIHAECDRLGVALKMVPDLFELSLSRVQLDDLAGIPLIDVRRAGLSTGARLVKRAIDIAVSSVVLVLAAPLLLLTAIAIKIDSPGPVLANQQRVGKGARPFTFFKFRSMYVGAEQHREDLAARLGAHEARIFKDRNDPRRTRVGRIIRQLSIDELPQLLNVLRGEMSLVGPRPPLPSEVARYQPHHHRRLQVIGGITGLWQVSGRSTIESFEEILIMDIFYIDNWSLGLDLRILLRTVVAVLARTGAY